MSKILGYKFVVEGDGIFPFDMLRYDSCHPTTQEAVAALASGYLIRGSAGRRKVTLTSTTHEPTVARWESFGWIVVSQEVVR